MTKFKPILFSTPMVEALLNGTKTQTRRLIDFDVNQKDVDSYEQLFSNYFSFKKNNEFVAGRSPKWNVGDILWVREKFRIMINCETEEFSSYEYFAGNQEFYEYLKKKGQKVKWKPSIFMTKEACRLFLKVKAIRVERLQDISEDNAIAEGIEILVYNEGTVYRDYLRDYSETNNSIVSFSTLWESINGLHSWSSNPFVWVIEFEPIEKPKDFIV